MRELGKGPRSSLLRALTKSPPTPPGSIPASTQAVATFLAKAEGILAGLGLADLVFEMVDPALQVWGEV